MLMRIYFKHSLISSIILFMTIFVGSLFSQPQPPIQRGQFPGSPAFHSDPKMREEIKAYFTTNVVPDLATWKAKFDKTLSTEDLATLNSLRNKLKDIKKAENEKIKNMIQDRKDGKVIDKDVIKKERENSRNQLIEFGKEIKPLAEKYKSSLTDIGTLAKPKAEVWKAEIKKISDKYQKPDNPRAMQNGILGLNDRNFKKLAVMFMMWDGSEEIIPSQTEPGMGNQFIGMNDGYWSEITSSVYPNQSVDNSNIKFNLTKAEKLTITILDISGKVVKTITDDYTVGEHTILFNGSDKNNVTLPIGSYNFKITSPSYNNSGKLILTK